MPYNVPIRELLSPICCDSQPALWQGVGALPEARRSHMLVTNPEGKPISRLGRHDSRCFHQQLANTQFGNQNARADYPQTLEGINIFSPPRVSQDFFLCNPPPGLGHPTSTLGPPATQPIWTST